MPPDNLLEEYIKGPAPDVDFGTTPSPSDAPPIPTDNGAKWLSDDVKSDPKMVEFWGMGLVNDEGLRTPEGDQMAASLDGVEDSDYFLDLYKKGIVNSSLQRTEKGDLYAEGEQAVIDAGPKAYGQWKKDGFQDEGQKASVGEIVKTLGTMAKDAFKFASEVADVDLSGVSTTQKEKDRRAVMRGEYFRESAKDAAFISKGTAKIFSDIFYADEELSNDAEWGYKKAQQDLDGLSNSEARVMGAAMLPFVSQDYLSEIAANDPESRLTPEETAEAKAMGEAGGQFFNPQEVIGNIATMGAAAGLKAGGVGVTKLATTARAVTKLEAKQATLQAMKNSLGSGVLPANGMTRAARSKALRAVDGQIDEVAKELTGRQSQLAAMTARAEASGLMAQQAAHGARVGVGKTAQGAGFAARKVGEGIGAALDKVPLLRGGGILGSAVAVGAGGPIAPLLLGMGALGAKGRGLRLVGETVETLGRTYTTFKGTAPYWRKVAKNANGNKLLMGAKHMESLAPIVNIPKDFGAAVAKGMFAEMPINYLANAGGEGWLEESIAESLVFGGAGHVIGNINGMGGVRAKGKIADFKTMALADSLELKAFLPEHQKQNFDKLDAGTKSMAGVYSAAFPDVTFEFVDTDQGQGGAWNNSTQTITIDVNSSNPLAPLISHEVGHHLHDMGVADMVREQLVGDRGYLLDSEGKLIPEAQKAKDAYEARLGKPISLEDFAFEWAAEALAPGISRAVGTGQLQQAVRRSPATRAIVDALADKNAFIDKLSRRSGVLFNQNGQPIRDTGLLGVKAALPAPLMRSIDQNLKSKAGMTSQQQSGSGKKAPAVKIDVNDPENAHIVDDMGAQFEQEKGKTKRDRWGKAIPLDTDTIKARESAGQIINDVAEKLRLPIISQNRNGVRYMLDDAAYGEILSRMEKEGVFNDTQLKGLRDVVRAIQGGDGTIFTAMTQKVYRARGKNKRIAGAHAPEWRSMIPFGLSVSNQGNILVNLIDPRQLDENVAKAANSAVGRKLYPEGVGQVMQDVGEMVQNHLKMANDDMNLTRFGEEKLNFLNAVFGDIGTKQKTNNPLLSKPVFKGLRSSAKTFRLDRINKMTEAPAANFPIRMERLQKRQLPEPVSPYQTSSNIISLAKELDPEGMKRRVKKEAAFVERESAKGMPLSPQMQGDLITIAAEGILQKHLDDPRVLPLLEPQARQLPEPVSKAGHLMTKEEYSAEVKKIKPLPRDVSYVKGVEVVRNPTGADYRQLVKEERSNTHMTGDDPGIRHTQDEMGNTWIWRASGGMHSHMEPAISIKEGGVGLNQNNQIPSHSSLIDDALRRGEVIPEKIIKDYPHRVEFNDNNKGKK